MTQRAPAFAPLVHGLARNPAAPADLLLHLLRTCPELACVGLRDRGALPGRVQDVMSLHPSRQVRGTLAEHPDVAPAIRTRLLADPDWRVRIRAFGRRGQRPLPDEVLIQLLAELPQPSPSMPHTSEELFGELFEATRYDRHLVHLAATHSDPEVRRRVAVLAVWRDDLRTLLTDPVPEVRTAAAESLAEHERVMQPTDLPEQHCHAFWYVLQRPLSRALVDRVLATDDVEALYFVAINPTTPPDVVETLLHHPDIGIRCRAATRADLTSGQLLRLVTDPAVEVRTAVSTHPGLTEQQRADIDIGASDTNFGPLEGLRSAGHGDASVAGLDQARQWAVSGNRLLRRRAARRPDLPQDLVAALADDPDLGVRVLLAHNHPHAPAALLLRCFLEYDRGRDRLSALPQFPKAGLARFADHPDPAVRRLVALDPHADAELVGRLSADPDIAVRTAMAGCPRLPLERITALLDAPELAEHAAANPALPAEQMWRMLEQDATH
ncbi:HEAT repeat domain-containing protein [Dactylosporangium salmoneum]|uniref:DUF2336 domain-containing protein n=1 Tax=Dactylosporangium salmoneum TaxID=53361 RepID=A0ABP5V7W6_9ACTN